MTLDTYCFNAAKAAGKVRRTGKAVFKDGPKTIERTLFYNSDNHKFYVVLNKSAYIFTPYFFQPAGVGTMYGSI